MTTKTPTELRANVAATLTATNDTKRTITGTILVYDELGNPSTGPTIFAQGSVEVPDELSRVKLLVQHDDYQAAVGYMTALDDADGQLVASFYLPEGDEADVVLADAAAQRRDGLSVGVSITDYDYDADQHLIIKAAQLLEVSIVTIPAYTNAHVTSVTASQQKGTIMPQPEIDYSKLAAALAPQQLSQIIPPKESSFGFTATSTVDAVANAFSTGYRKGVSPVELVAALNDLVPALDTGVGIIRPQWIDEVWQASRVGRPFFDGAATKKNITGLKVQGWKYDLTVRPKVDPYAGNKTAIPESGSLKTIPVEADTVRRAGGWDIDRALIDLGSKDFISALLTAATDEYKRATEAWLVTKLLEAATPVTAGASFAETLAGLGIAAVQLGASLSTIQLAPDQWLAFASLKDTEVPWWLRNQGELNLGTTEGTAGKLKFSVNPDLAAGTILAADPRAYTPFERENLINVQAVNIANGGIDVGVFGYISAIVNDPRAVLKVVAGGEG